MSPQASQRPPAGDTRTGTGRTAWPDAPASAFPAQSPAPGWLSFSFCRSFDPLLSGRGDRGGTPLGAERRPLLGCPRQHKSYARYPTRQGSGLLVGGFFSAERCYPTRQGSGLLVGGFFSAERWGINRFGDGSSAVIVGFSWLSDGNSAVILFAVLSECVPPPFGGVVSLAPWVGRSWRNYHFRTVIQLSSQKRSRYIDAPTPAGVFLSLGFLCGCLCTGSIAVFSSPIKWEFQFNI